ncbi:MAG: site-2 protease family protein, partial [Planctomycetota bacterium]
MTQREAQTDTPDETIPSFVVDDFRPANALPLDGELDPDSGRRTGTWVAMYPHGAIASEISYDAKGLPTGQATQYFPHGEKMLQLSFSAKPGRATIQTYYPDGNVESRDHVAFGVSHGTCERFHPDGRIAARVSQHLGRAHGTQEVWDESGQCLHKRRFAYGVPMDGGTYVLSVLQNSAGSWVMLIVAAAVLAVLAYRGFGSLAGLLLLGLILVVHEAGHWLIARAVGIPIRDFRIGVGPHLATFSLFRTDVQLHLFPLIGWVKEPLFFNDEHADYLRVIESDQAPAPPSPDEEIPELWRGNVPQTSGSQQAGVMPRLAFYLGGIIFNLMTAFLALWLAVYPSDPGRAALVQAKT